MQEVAAAQGLCVDDRAGVPVGVPVGLRATVRRGRGTAGAIFRPGMRGRTGPGQNAPARPAAALGRTGSPRQGWQALRQPSNCRRRPARCAIVCAPQIARVSLLVDDGEMSMRASAHNESVKLFWMTTCLPTSQVEKDVRQLQRRRLRSGCRAAT